MPLPGVLFWSPPSPGLGPPADPETLGGFHPVWRAEAERFGPWDPACLTCEGQDSRVWLSRRERSGRSTYLAGRIGSALDAGWHLESRGCLGAWGSVVAAIQTRGRGQLRREWHSPAGNLYAALRLPGGFPWAPELLPLLTGYLLLAGLQARGLELSIKWPNDLVLGGTKIGGILIEERRSVCLAGVGINLLSAGLPGVRSGAALPAGGLDQAGPPPAPVALWRELVQKAENCYQTVLSSSKPSEFVSLVEQHLAFLGKRVAVDGNPDIRGRVSGISERGGLVLRGERGTAVITSGSIIPLEA